MLPLQLQLQSSIGYEVVLLAFVKEVAVRHFSLAVEVEAAEVLSERQSLVVLEMVHCDSVLVC